MKGLFVSFLIFCITGQAFMRTAWVLDYQWNRAVYLKNCENRDKPSLHCNGKCYLMKKIAASEQNTQKEPRLPQGFSQIKDIQLYFEPSGFFPFFGTPEITAKKFPIYIRRLVPDPLLAGIFKPPAA